MMVLSSEIIKISNGSVPLTKPTTKMMAQQTILQQTVPQTNMSQVMEVRMLMVHSQVRINVQMLRTQKRDFIYHR